MTDSLIASPREPTLEEMAYALDWAVINAEDAAETSRIIAARELYARDAEVLRWLASHLASLVRDAQRVDDLEQRIAFLTDNKIPDPKTFGGRLDARIGAMQEAVRDARDVLLGIAKATNSEWLIDVSGRLAKAHDGLYSVNRELRAQQSGSGATASGEPGRTLAAACPSPSHTTLTTTSLSDAAQKP